MGKNLRICSFDIETLPAIAATFTLYPDAINHENVLADTSIVCICWKDLGKPTKSISVLDDPKLFKKDHTSDYHVCKTIRDEFDGVDILIGHNLKRFDVKRLNARLIFHGLEPLPMIQMIDTLTELKKVATFTSHRLDYLGKHLFEDGKQQTSKGLWLRCLKGDVDAIKEMTAYCKKDVVLLEKLYLKIRPYMKSHPNVATPDTCNCPKCGSSKTKKDGIRVRATGARYQTYACNDCGARFSDSKILMKPTSKV